MVLWKYVGILLIIVSPKTTENTNGCNNDNNNIDSNSKSFENNDVNTNETIPSPRCYLKVFRVFRIIFRRIRYFVLAERKR